MKIYYFFLYCAALCGCGFLNEPTDLIGVYENPINYFHAPGSISLDYQIELGTPVDSSNVQSSTSWSLTINQNDWYMEKPGYVEKGYIDRLSSNVINLIDGDSNQVFCYTRSTDDHHITTYTKSPDYNNSDSFFYEGQGTIWQLQNNNSR